MSKTKNAFALRDFDTERILQRPFFLERLGIVYETTDTEILEIHDARNVAHLGSAEMVEQLSFLQKLKEAVAAYKGLLEVHINRLESLCTSYAKRFAETAAQMWQDEYRRAQNLRQAYDDALSNVIKVKDSVEGLERLGEKAIDQQRRKEFAFRLKERRQQLNMKQSDIAAQVKIAPPSFSNYEQGRADPQIPTLIRIAKALGVSADWLLGL